jgi:hypothetical protein
MGLIDAVMESDLGVVADLCVRPPHPGPAQGREAVRHSRVTALGLTPERWRAGVGARPLYLEGCILPEGVAGEGNQIRPLGR